MAKPSRLLPTSAVGPRQLWLLARTASAHVSTPQASPRATPQLWLLSTPVRNVTTAAKPPATFHVWLEHGQVNHKLLLTGQPLQNNMTELVNHKLLLTGTPLQNNMTELFMLLHFLDDSKFSSLEEFELTFKDLGQEGQVAKLHGLLSPHLLRRLKKDVLKGMPPKEEQIVRVELSTIQRDFYRSLLARHYPVLAAGKSASALEAGPSVPCPCSQELGKSASALGGGAAARPSCALNCLVFWLRKQVSFCPWRRPLRTPSVLLSKSASALGGAAAGPSRALKCLVMELRTSKSASALGGAAAGPSRALKCLVMELRKCCNHPYLFQDAEHMEPDPIARFEALLKSSGKLELVDKMVSRLIPKGHRILIYSQFTRALDILEDWLHGWRWGFQHIDGSVPGAERQFTRTLDILEDWLHGRRWGFQRIDGSVPGAERQRRIDRFNNNPEANPVFLLSTRAGGLGINLATADTVIIYDSDWNPHNDLQAQAQKNPVMIYRLVTRATIEERMMQVSKKKMIMEHLVVRKMPGAKSAGGGTGAGGELKQSELDDILRYGAQELFADDAPPAKKDGGGDVKAAEGMDVEGAADKEGEGKEGGGAKAAEDKEGEGSGAGEGKGKEGGEGKGKEEEGKGKEGGEEKEKEGEEGKGKEAEEVKVKEVEEAKKKASRIVYDDAAIDALVDRSALEARHRRGEEDKEEGDDADEGIMQAFKVATFSMVEEKEEEEKEAELVKAVEEAEDKGVRAGRTRGGGGGGGQEDKAEVRELTPEDKDKIKEALEDPSKLLEAVCPTQDNKASGQFWEGLLKDHFSGIQEVEAAAMGRGRRERNKVTYAEGDRAQTPRSESGTDEDSSGSDSADQDGVKRGPGRPRTREPPSGGRGRKRTRLDEAPSPSKRPPPFMMGRGEELKVYGLNKHDRLVFLNTVMQYGLRATETYCQEMYDLFNKRLPNHSPLALESYTNLFVTVLSESPTTLDPGSPTLRFGVPKWALLGSGLDAISREALLSRLGFMHLARHKVYRNGLGPPFADFQLPHGPRILSPTRIWTTAHDGQLLIGMLLFGFGQFGPILSEKGLGIKETLRKELAIPVDYDSGYEVALHEASVAAEAAAQQLAASRAAQAADLASAAPTLAIASGSQGEALALGGPPAIGSAATAQDDAGPKPMEDVQGPRRGPSAAPPAMQPTAGASLGTSSVRVAAGDLDKGAGNGTLESASAVQGVGTEAGEAKPTAAYSAVGLDTGAGNGTLESASAAQGVGTEAGEAKPTPATSAVGLDKGARSVAQGDMVVSTASAPTSATQAKLPATSTAMVVSTASAPTSATQAKPPATSTAMVVSTASAPTSATQAKPPATSTAMVVSTASAPTSATQAIPHEVMELRKKEVQWLQKRLEGISAALNLEFKFVANQKRPGHAFLQKGPKDKEPLAHNPTLPAPRQQYTTHSQLVMAASQHSRMAHAQAGLELVGPNRAPGAAPPQAAPRGAPISTVSSTVSVIRMPGDPDYFTLPGIDTAAKFPYHSIEEKVVKANLANSYNDVCNHVLKMRRDTAEFPYHSAEEKVAEANLANSYKDVCNHILKMRRDTAEASSRVNANDPRSLAAASSTFRTQLMALEVLCGRMNSYLPRPGTSFTGLGAGRQHHASAGVRPPGQGYGVQARPPGQPSSSVGFGAAANQPSGVQARPPGQPSSSVGFGAAANQPAAHMPLAHRQQGAPQRAMVLDRQPGAAQQATVGSAASRATEMTVPSRATVITQHQAMDHTMAPKPNPVASPSPTPASTGLRSWVAQPQPLPQPGAPAPVQLTPSRDPGEQKRADLCQGLCEVRLASGTALAGFGPSNAPKQKT
eukprot:gene16466-22688_t